jgi:hypothetical protein
MSRAVYEQNWPFVLRLQTLEHVTQAGLSNMPILPMILQKS